MEVFLQKVILINIEAVTFFVALHARMAQFEIRTLGKNACKIANMRYAYPAVIQVKISNIGCLDEVIGFILSKWRTPAINAIKNKTQYFGK